MYLKHQQPECLHSVFKAYKMKLLRDILYTIAEGLPIAVLVAVGVFLLTLPSCKTCVPVVEIRDSVRVEYKLDSVYIWQHDSIFRDRWREGDTVFVILEKYKTLYKDKIVEIHDTIRTEQNIVQERKVVPAFYKGCTIALWVLIACVVVYIVVRVLIRVYLKK